MIKILISLIFILISSQSRAYTYILGTGSFSGTIYMGIEHNSDNYWRGSLLAGYAPKYLAGEDLYSASGRFSIVSPYLITAFQPYAGVGLISSLGDKDTFYLLPNRYPNKYYPATGYYFSPYVGVDFAFLNNIVFFEISSLDYYLEAASRSRGRLDITEVTTFGFGIRRLLEW